MPSASQRRAAPYAILILVSLLPVAGALVRGEVLIFRDHFDYFLPLREFTASLLRGGELPLWNPYNASGERWLANPQTGIFYPPAWLFVVLPLAIASNLFLALHLALLGCGAYRLFRRVASIESSSLAAIALVVSGPTLSLLDISNNLASFAWVPWVITSAFAPRRTDRDAIFLALAFLGGEPSFAAAAAIIYAIVVAASRTRAALMRVASTAVVTVLLVLPQLIPFIGLLRGSDRATGLAAGEAFRNAMTLREWFVAVVPVGSASRDQHFIAVMFIPLIAFAAAIAACFGPPRSERRAFTLLLVTAAAIATIPSLPVVAELLGGTAIAIVRYPSRFVVFALLALCGLAAIGLDEILKGGRARSAAAIAAAFILLIALVIIGRPALPVVVGLNAAAAALWIAFAFIRSEATFMRRALFASAIGALIAGALIAAAPLTNSARPATLKTPWAKLIRGEAKVARVLATRQGHWSAFRRAKLMSGYRNLIERKFDFSTPAPVVNRTYQMLHDQVLGRPRLQLLSSLGVGYVVSERSLRVPQFELIRSRDPILYANTAAAPAATVIPKPPSTHRAARRPVATRFVGTNRVEIDVESDRGGVVLLSQTDAPGWSVSIDGAAAQKDLSGGLFRAVRVPAGRHRIVWTYREPFLIPAMLLSLATVTFILTRRRHESARSM